jgi:hypothetical protein
MWLDVSSSLHDSKNYYNFSYNYIISAGEKWVIIKIFGVKTFYLVWNDAWYVDVVSINTAGR